MKTIEEDDDDNSEEEIESNKIDDNTEEEYERERSIKQEKEMRQNGTYYNTKYKKMKKKFY